MVMAMVFYHHCHVIPACVPAIDAAADVTTVAISKTHAAAFETALHGFQLMYAALFWMMLGSFPVRFNQVRLTFAHEQPLERASSSSRPDNRLT